MLAKVLKRFLIFLFFAFFIMSICFLQKSSFDAGKRKVRGLLNQNVNNLKHIRKTHTVNEDALGSVNEKNNGPRGKTVKNTIDESNRGKNTINVATRKENKANQTDIPSEPERRNAIASASNANNFNKLLKISEHTHTEIIDIIGQPQFNFSKSYKNPCFIGDKTNAFFNDNRLHCLPYFYLIGVKKSGTTDLFHRVSSHPEFRDPGFKEAQWFARMRVGLDCYAFQRKQIFKETLKKGIDNRSIKYYISLFDRAATTIQSCSTNCITAEASPSNLHMHTGWELLPGNEGLTEPVYTNFHYIKHITPNAKIIIIFRDPVTRLFSDFMHELRLRNRHYSSEKIEEMFHKQAVDLIQTYDQCFIHSPIRRCMYNNSMSDQLIQKGVFLAESFRTGFYAFYMRELLSVFGRKQILPLLMTDYLAKPKETLEQVFNFLEMNVEHLIENGDNEGLQELQKHQKRYLQQEANKARNRSDRVLEKDDLAMCLLPSDIPQPGYTLYPAKTTGNGDCLLNAVSISLNGDEALSNIIRASTAVELFLNAGSYAQHKQIDIAVSHPDTSLTADSFRCLILTDKANKVYNECKNFRKAIEIEARETCKAGNWSSFVHVMAISSLLNRNVWSVYPESNKGIRPLFHSKITQPMADCTEDIFITWSRDGNLDNREGYAFEPNHFVPLMQMQESETTDFNDSDDEVLLSLSAEMLEIKLTPSNEEYDKAKMEGLKNELSTETEDLHGVIEEVSSLEKEVAEQDKSTEKKVAKLDKMTEKEVAEQDKMTGAEVAEQDDSKGEEVTELDISTEVKETKQDKSTERDNGKEILSKEKGACVLSEQKYRKGNVKQRKTFEEPGHDNLKEDEMKQNKSKERQ